MRSGSVVFDKDYITFTGRAGLAHPWTWCLAAALAVLASVPLALLFSHFATPMHLELSELIIISCFPAIIVALLAVYLPASVLLPFLFGRITLARKQITHFERMGREVTCWISSSEYQYQYLNLVFATDIEAELFYDIVRS